MAEMDSFITHLQNRIAEMETQTQVCRAALQEAVAWRTAAAAEVAQRDTETSTTSAKAPANRSTSVATTPMTAAILRESDAEYTAEAMEAALRERGWHSPAENPVDAVRAALSRLTSRGVAERPSPGVYRGTPSRGLLTPQPSNGSVPSPSRRTDGDELSTQGAG